MLQARICSHLEPLVTTYAVLTELVSVACIGYMDTDITEFKMGLLRPLKPNGRHVYTLVHQLSSMWPQVSREMVRCPQDRQHRLNRVSALCLDKVCLDWR